MPSDVPAARSALRVLRALAGRPAPVPASVLARETGIPRSTLYQLARVMMDEGFVVHYPEERSYGLSSLVTEIGTGTLRTDRVRRLAHPLLDRLVSELPVPVVSHLATLSGAEVTYVDRISAPRAPTTVSAVGVRLPAHLTATGRAALAALTRQQVRAAYPDASSLVRRAGPGPASLAELDAILRRAREVGWAQEDGEIDPEYASVAAAATDRAGYPVASIGVTFRVDADADRDALGAAVLRASCALDERLGPH